MERFQNGNASGAVSKTIFNIIICIIIIIYIILLQVSVFHCLGLSNIYHLGMNFPHFRYKNEQGNISLQRHVTFMLWCRRWGGGHIHGDISAVSLKMHSVMVYLGASENSHIHILSAFRSVVNSMSEPPVCSGQAVRATDPRLTLCMLSP